MDEETQITPDSEKALKFGTAVKMFETFAEIMPKSSGTGGGGNSGSEDVDVTIRFDATDGLFSTSERYMSTVTKLNAVLVTPNSAPVRVGYDFDGWYTAAFGGNNVSGMTVEDDSYVTYYAHWTAKTYSISLDLNYDSAPTGGLASVTYDSALGSVTPPVRDGYTFLGYFDTPAESGGKKYFDEDGDMVCAWDKAATDTVLYARWESAGVVTPPSNMPTYDANSGRYTNDSIITWMNGYADGLVYGVQIPKYASSPATTATKTGANAGLQLDASSDEFAGRNDYTGKKLFMCPRVNGGVDANGMPYVTAIEGMDDSFDATENTYALTPVYYFKYTETEDNVQRDFCDTELSGFSACAGAYTPGGQLRPYILRACYMDSDGQCSSKSGELPASKTYSNAPNYFEHCANNDFTASKGREDGLTMLAFGDITYQTEFMQLMLGVKAPKTVAKGCIDYSATCKCAVGESNVKRVVVASTNADKFPVGAYVSVGTSTSRSQATGHSLAYAAKIVSKENLSSGNVALNLDLAENITTTTDTNVNSMWYRNGSCDNVMGTFGCFSEDGLMSGKAPFRFQNCEWQLGLFETVANMYHIGADVYIAPDITACSAINTGSGWTKLQTAVPTSYNYISDYKTEHGARVPVNIGATSTTGYNVYLYCDTGTCEWLVGGTFGDASEYGVGYVAADNSLSNADWNIGGRSSTIGRSALAE